MYLGGVKVSKAKWKYIFSQLPLGLKELNLDNVAVLNKRSEDIDDTFDFIVCRAVAKLKELKIWTKGSISSQHNHPFKNGLICLKGGDLKEELSLFPNAKQILLSDYFYSHFLKILISCL